MINPRDVAERVRACPKCGEQHYTFVMAPGVPLRVQQIRCAQCGANILRAYRKAQPAPFGLTIGQLDRFAVLVGGALIVVIVVRLFVFR